MRRRVGKFLKNPFFFLLSRLVILLKCSPAQLVRIESFHHLWRLAFRSNSHSSKWMGCFNFFSFFFIYIYFFLFWLYTNIQFLWVIQCITFIYLYRPLDPFHIMLYWCFSKVWWSLCQCYLVVMICLIDWSRLESIYCWKIIKQFC